MLESNGNITSTSESENFIRTQKLQHGYHGEEVVCLLLLMCIPGQGQFCLKFHCFSHRSRNISLNLLQKVLSPLPPLNIFEMPIRWPKNLSASLYYHHLTKLFIHFCLKCSDFHLSLVFGALHYLWEQVDICHLQNQLLWKLARNSLIHSVFAFQVLKMFLECIQSTGLLQWHQKPKQNILDLASAPWVGCLFPKLSQF